MVFFKYIFIQLQNFRSCKYIFYHGIPKLRNKFDALQEKSETYTPNDEYKNFVNAHLDAAAECIPTKQRAKHSPMGDISSLNKACRCENCFQI